MSATTTAAMDVDSTRKYLSAEAASIMREGITLTFSRWEALQMAVHNEWGGPDSRHNAEKSVDEVLSWFMERKKHYYIDDLEKELEKVMRSLNTQLDDDSIEEIAEDLMLMHEECLEGNYRLVERLRVKPHPTVSHLGDKKHDA